MEAHDVSRVEQLVDRIYDAALAADPWKSIIPEVEQALRGRVGIFRRRPDSVSVVSACNGSGPDEIAQYEDHFWDQDRAMEMLASDPTARIVRDTSLIEDQERRKAGFYNDYLRRMGASRGLYASIMRTEDEVLVISAQRPKEAGDYTEAECRLVEELLPHLRRSVHLRQKISEREGEAGTLIENLERASLGVMLVDANARLCFANKAAEAHLTQGTLRIDGQRIAAGTEELTSRLTRAIAKAAAPHHGKADQFPLQNGRPAIAPRMPQVLVTPVPARHSEIGSGDPLAMLVLYEQGVVIEDRGSIRAYDLTPAETRLLNALVNGERLRGYAERTGVSVATVKTHLSNLFSKTGEQRQADLVRKALSDPVLNRALYL